MTAFLGASTVRQRSRTQSVTSRRDWHEIRYHLVWRNHMPLAEAYAACDERQMPVARGSRGEQPQAIEPPDNSSQHGSYLASPKD